MPRGLNNVTHLNHLALHSTVRHHALQHGDHIVTTDHCDVTSLYLWAWTVTLSSELTYYPA